LQVLASKDAALFRQLVKFYETKQYKKGIKSADQVQQMELLCMSSYSTAAKLLCVASTTADHVDTCVHLLL
jgi:hypothetical protein